MADRTISERVRRHRSRVRQRDKLVRIEVLAPADAKAELKEVARRAMLRGRAVAADPRVSAVLATVNAPRPVEIDGATLVACLRGRDLDDRWRPHVEALLTEVSPEALHDLVLSGAIDFDDLERAETLWGIRSVHGDWIHEMARLAVAQAVRASARDRGSAPPRR